MKKISLLVGLLSLLVFAACNQKPKVKKREDVSFTGYAQGTSFSIKYEPGKPDPEQQVLEIFRAMDHSMSLYDTTSLIVKANRKDTVVEVDVYFAEVHQLAMQVYRDTKGAFDPTVYPLVKYWGFGSEQFMHPEKIDSLQIDSLRKLCGFDKTFIEVRSENGATQYYFHKPHGHMQVDFNGIAQGYTVDKIQELFASLGYENYMVEVGGEISSRGVNSVGKPWSIGIDKPVENQVQRKLIAIAKVSDAALATSGNYRKFYEKDGVKYSHTLDPKTGYPVTHNLLSATVRTKSCALADAYATAFMVMGFQDSREFTESRNDLAVYLIAAKPDKPGFNSYVSPLFQEFLDKLE